MNNNCNHSWLAVGLELTWCKSCGSLHYTKLNKTLTPTNPIINTLNTETPIKNTKVIKILSAIPQPNDKFLVQYYISNKNYNWTTTLSKELWTKLANEHNLTLNNDNSYMFASP